MTSKVVLGEDLLNTAYESSMSRTIGKVTQPKGATLRIDGATNMLAKFICNVIVHTSIGFLASIFALTFTKKSPNM